ncbi:hypothetical protein D1F64_13950 [Breoghania sp. L-A4]|nr:hypothetical protein D1F64_13950 [Breoghania sp. L-A4]
MVGAHLRGMPLNGELTRLDARFVESARTSADYRLYALTGQSVPKPGMLRGPKGSGGAIALELWAMTPAGFGIFVAGVPSPMSIGTVLLEDGRSVKGFLVEPEALEGADDITALGDWRAYVARRAEAAR